MKEIQPQFVEAGVWIRPYNCLIYLMPPYIINTEDLRVLTNAITTIVANIQQDTL